VYNIEAIETFKEYFRDYNDCYIVIGGTACAIIFEDKGLDFRSTKDIDEVLVGQKISKEFIKKFWEYIKAGEYKIYSRGDDETHYYRFLNPQNQEQFPAMIELFARSQDGIELPDGCMYTPITTEDEYIQSLSAILLNEDYYNFLIEGKTIKNDISILDAAYIVPLKIRAHLDLTEKHNKGEHVNNRDLKKHYKDVFRLMYVVSPEGQIKVTELIYNDIKKFIDWFDETEIEIDSAKKDELKHLLLSKYCI
jgi:hypothetical protein